MKLIPGDRSLLDLQCQCRQHMRHENIYLFIFDLAGRLQCKLQADEVVWVLFEATATTTLTVGAPITWN